MTDADPLKTHESTKRVLYHLVHTYQSWRNERLGAPNAFTDDAVRIGEQHLREIDWFPENKGWLANSTEPVPVSAVPDRPDVLALIDAELKRLREPYTGKDSLHWGRRKKGWVEGLNISHEIAAEKLQSVRDAYIVESLTRETESLRLYGISEDDIDAW